ncbi:hypothetical protein FA10DRAFT_266040 [Acaromyces ingoldii]|uniref:EthD domain-containing protein n=1 Tax=Acaromyces ingoldii TaxID=215250 RepID=A0A316YU98_9BASI|nr:hypothetical protein FA10DRAFT_266040 [Acaromyces ingoldii]PWN92248.1 hypothetical protein FA10DRAFT_266040 [Acaromyces ingoldii]
MASVFIYVSKKPSMSLEDFKAYYETKHVPLLHKLIFSHSDASPVLYYARNYHDRRANLVDPIAAAGQGQKEYLDFDCLSILKFKTLEDVQKTMAIYQEPEVSRVITDDEEQFADRSLLKMFIVEECVS